MPSLALSYHTAKLALPEVSYEHENVSSGTLESGKYATKRTVLGSKGILALHLGDLSRSVDIPHRLCSPSVKPTNFSSALDLIKTWFPDPLRPPSTSLLAQGLWRMSSQSLAVG
jgi:hypothetical protein